MGKREMGNKGQQLTLGTIMLTILGLTVLVLLIFGFSQGWSYLFGKLGLLPDDLNDAAIACKNYALLDEFKLSFCQFRQLTIEERKGFYNCPYIHRVSEKVLGTGNVDFEAESDSCSSEASINYCKQLRDNEEPDWEEIRVNEKVCGGEEGHDVQAPEPRVPTEAAVKNDSS